MLATWKCGSINPDRSAFRSTVWRLPSVASGQYYDGDGAIEAGYTLAPTCFGLNNGVHLSRLDRTVAIKVLPEHLAEIHGSKVP